MDKDLEKKIAQILSSTNNHLSLVSNPKPLTKDKITFIKELTNIKEEGAAITHFELVLLQYFLIPEEVLSQVKPHYDEDEL